ncbi:MAG: Flp pilus assembly complex ATPase component TadA [Candidatus Omnitrophica bacterium]|nr:Flp pilus assembly complex ATPase component TadA [Candidatus Omnitrophota bacterium]
MDLENAAPKVLEDMIRQAERAGASDVHLQMLGKVAQVSFRLDGVMTPAWELASPVAERVFGRIKFLARLKTYQESMPQDGRIDRGDLGARNDIRVATYPTVTGEKIVLRLFSSNAAPTLKELGFPTQAIETLESQLRQNAGLLLLTGPAGSGKTTTIYACLRFIARLGGRHVITVEDPAEQIIPGIMQTEVNEALGLTFATAARHLLRQDPQVLVIGEIRDDETANLAVRAALTGHLVISTLHAGSCKGVFERLQVMCADPFAALSSVALVLNQRLARRICSSCHGEKCETCLQTGYRGRVPLVEWVRVDDVLRRRIRTEGVDAVCPVHSLDQAARESIEQRMSDRAEIERLMGGEVRVSPSNPEA